MNGVALVADNRTTKDETLAKNNNNRSDHDALLHVYLSQKNIGRNWTNINRTAAHEMDLFDTIYKTNVADLCLTLSKVLSNY